MALADKLKKTSVRNNTVQFALATMSEDERSVLIEALTDLSYSNADIGRALRAEGYAVSNDQVRNFRNKIKESM